MLWVYLLCSLLWQSVFCQSKSANEYFPMTSVGPWGALGGTSCLKTLYGQPAEALGVVGNAASFDGKSALRMTDKREDTCFWDPEKCSDGLTVSVWVKITANPNDKYENYIVGNGGQTYASYGFALSLAPDNTIRADVKTKSKWYRISKTPALEHNKWLHLAMTWKSDGLHKFYINGKAGGSATVTPNVRATTSYNDFVVGFPNNADKDKVQYAFYGLIDEVQFISRAVDDVGQLSVAADQYFPMTKVDSSGSPPDLVVFCGQPGQAPGVIGNAVSLDGKSALKMKATRSDSCFWDPEKCTDGFTVSLWAKITSNVNDKYENYFLGNGGQTYASYGFALSLAPDNTIRADVKTKTTWYRINNTPALEKNRWYHLAMTWSKDKVHKFYIDGKPANAKSAASSNARPTTAYNEFRIGYPNNADASKVQYAFTGLIDEVQFFPAAFDDAGVAQIYTSYNLNVCGDLD